MSSSRLPENVDTEKLKAERKYNRMSMEELVSICVSYGMKNDLDRTTMVAHLTQTSVYQYLKQSDKKQKKAGAVR